MMNDGPVPSSFRDPSGFLFHREGRLYRQVNSVYQEDYDYLIQSGLYAHLAASNLLIPHTEADIAPEEPSTAYKIIRPQELPFISYPYEWCFSQLKDAALTTLTIQKAALKFGMSLKDASAYNIQFYQNKPIFIDTLSFEKYSPDKPWVAYQQFCRHFLAPLLLTKYVDARLNKLLINFIEGIPLELAIRLLPKQSFLRMGTFLHIWLQGRIESRLVNQKTHGKERQLKPGSLELIIDSLTSYVKRIKFKLPKTEWGSYYDETNYSEAAWLDKRALLADFLQTIKPSCVWDIGANDGSLSRIASEMGAFTLCFDLDPAAVEKNYRECVKNLETNIFPLIVDIANPSPAIGWSNRERLSLLERSAADTLLALALLHHLAFTYNLPFSHIAGLFQQLCRHLIIEFIPKHDSQVQMMLAQRADIFPHYSQEAFEIEFGRYFDLVTRKEIKDSERLMYLFKKKNNNNKWWSP